jgi:chromosomal replication initiation ATPase DnaA
MQVESELLPAIFHIVGKCEDDLSQLIGSKVKIKFIYRESEINDVMLQERICSAFGVSWNDINGPSRKTNIKNARHSYWWISMELFGRSMNSLGKECGDRDHTTVISAKKRMKKIMDVGTSPLAELVTGIANELKSTKN